MTEDQIERRVEIATDRYDSMYMKGAISKNEYDGFMRYLAQWADAQYRLMKQHKRSIACAVSKPLNKDL